MQRGTQIKCPHFLSLFFPFLLSIINIDFMHKYCLLLDKDKLHTALSCLITNRSVSVWCDMITTIPLNDGSSGGFITRIMCGKQVAIEISFLILAMYYSVFGGIFIFKSNIYSDLVSQFSALLFSMGNRPTPS